MKFIKTFMYCRFDSREMSKQCRLGHIVYMKVSCFDGNELCFLAFWIITILETEADPYQFHCNVDKQCG